MSQPLQYSQSPQPGFLPPGCSSPAVQPFSADWHPQFGARLNVFPRNLVLAGRDHRRVCYWPDLATFVDDARCRHLLYAPWGPSRYSLHLVYEESPGRWHAFKYREHELLAQVHAASFPEAMAQAAALGVEADEAAG